MDKTFIILVCNSCYCEPLQIYAYLDIESALFAFDNEFDLDEDKEYYDHVYLYEQRGLYFYKLGEKSC